MHLIDLQISNSYKTLFNYYISITILKCHPTKLNSPPNFWKFSKMWQQCAGSAGKHYMTIATLKGIGIRVLLIGQKKATQLISTPTPHPYLIPIILLAA